MERGHKFSTVPEYIASHPPAVRKLLNELRRTIRSAAPDADETISYNMPAYRQRKVLVYFAGYKSHIGFYPTSSAIKFFQKEISRFKNSKGAVQFPLNEPLPVKLIAKVVKFRVEEVA